MKSHCQNSQMGMILGKMLGDRGEEGGVSLKSHLSPSAFLFPGVLSLRLLGLS